MSAKTKKTKNNNKIKTFRSELWTFLTGKNRSPIDLLVLILVLALFAYGFAMVCSVESVRDGIGEMAEQLIYGIIGIALMILIAASDYRIFNNYMAIVFFIVTVAMNGFNAVKAILGGAIDRGSGFQASELLKFSLILFLTYILCGCEKIFQSKRSGKRTRDGKPVRTMATHYHRQFRFEKFFFSNIRTTKGVNIIVMIATLVSTLIVLMQSHLSGAIIVLLIGFIVMLAGGADKKMLAVFAAAGVIMLVVVYINPDVLLHIPGLKRYQYERVALWKYKMTAVQATSEEFKTNRSQVEASLKAIGSGGWFGVGFNKSIQKQSYLAAADTDFIFAVVVEELGFVGAAVLLALFGLLVYRCIKISMSVEDKFGSLIALGVAAQIGLEVLMNVAVVTDSMPNTGITLPFFSNGGSALIMLFVEMGFVLSVSKNSVHSRVRNKKLYGGLSWIEGEKDEFEQQEDDEIK